MGGLGEVVEAVLPALDVDLGDGGDNGDAAIVGGGGEVLGAVLEEGQQV